MALYQSHSIKFSYYAILINTISKDFFNTSRLSSTQRNTLLGSLTKYLSEDTREVNLKAR